MIYQVVKVLRQSAGQMQGPRTSNLDAEIARLQILNESEAELARAIARMVDVPYASAQEQGVFR